MATSESKGRFFLQNESIRITNRIDSNRELECSITGRMPFLPPNQQRQSTEGIKFIANCSVIHEVYYCCYQLHCMIILCMYYRTLYLLHTTEWTYMICLHVQMVIFFVGVALLISSFMAVYFIERNSAILFLPAAT